MKVELSDVIAFVTYGGGLTIYRGKSLKELDRKATEDEVTIVATLHLTHASVGDVALAALLASESDGETLGGAITDLVKNAFIEGLRFAQRDAPAAKAIVGNDP